jgi:hypothetical protein
MPYKDVNEGRKHAREYYHSHNKERTDYKRKKYNTDEIFKEKLQKYNKAYRDTHPENYSSWKKTQSEKHKLETIERKKLKYGDNPEKYKKDTKKRKGKEYRTSIRNKCIEKIANHRGMLQPMCWRCQEKSISLLTVAHINGTGSSDRKIYKSTLKIYKNILNETIPIENINLECYNCNMCEGFYGKYPDEFSINLFLNGTGKYMSKYRKTKKLKAFEKIAEYRNRPVSCHICGNESIWCLSIAHLDNSGFLIKDKQEFARRISKGTEPLENLEIECFNCNCLKERNSKSI